MFRTIKDYIEVTKPRSVFLLSFTALVSILIASSYRPSNWQLIILAFVSVLLGVMGANAITCYIDKDIDEKMVRTRERPIPSRRIEPPESALSYGITLVFIATLIAFYLHPLAALFMVLGALDSTLVYNQFLKRRTPLNIILGAPSGGMPILVGWTAISGKLELIPLLMAIMVIFWTPNHIWSLAIFFAEDYRKAKVPMLPVVVGEKKAVRWIALSALFLIALSFLLYWMGGFGKVYLLISLSLNIVIGSLNLYLLISPSRKGAWWVFKISSPYLFLIFLAMALDTYF